MNTLGIPHITLLDFDNERYGGGWGRIQYVIKQLIINGVAKEKLVTVLTKSGEKRVLSDDEIDKINEFRIVRPDDWPLKRFINMLEKYNVFFSAPLDIDFLMLQHYKKHYLGTLSTNEGPDVSYVDQYNNNKKVKLTNLDNTDILQIEGLKKRKEEAIRATLKDKSELGNSFTEKEKELMIWYQYFFLGRGKPTTHMQFLSSISDDELIEGLPAVFEKIVERAKELLGDVEYGEGL